MAGQRELKKHLAGIKTTGKLANAMKTVATAKFARLSALQSNIADYTACCGEVLCGLGKSALFGPTPGGNGTLYIMFTGNKGLCGGYNSELCTFFDELEKEEGYKLIVCGKKGVEYCAQKGIAAQELCIDDLPTTEDAASLLDIITANYGTHSNVKLVYRHFKNVMQQIPTVRDLFSPVKEGEVLFVPSREEAEKAVATLCVKALLYGTLVEVATGVQAATLMTMRNAADNAAEEAAKTETILNRVRQSELTADVIESASGAVDEFYK